MTPPPWVRWLVLPLDLVLGIPLILIRTVIFVARRADDRLRPWAILQRVARLAWASAVLGGLFLIAPPLAVAIGAGWAWRLGRERALEPVDRTARSQPPMANISIRGRSAVASVRRSE